jgi:predicted RNase H-like nuclease (RuvC/YqgF family)
MSMTKLEEEIDKLQNEREELEGKCDTLDLCKEDDGCSKCDVYKKIEAVDNKIEVLEEKIEDLVSADEEDD